MDTRATVELGVLGALRARATGVEVDIGPPQRRTVLAVLICGASQVIPTGRLLDCVWDDTASPSAIGSLHTHVSRLRKELGPDVIVRHPYGYALQLRPDQLDADVFSSWVRRGRSSVAKGQLRCGRDLLVAALSLWRGRAYDEFQHAWWARDEIVRLHTERLDALEARLDADVELGDTDVLGELEALVVEHPLHDGFCGRLMIALYRSGCQSDALSSARRHRRNVVEATGLAQAPWLTAIELRILRHDRCLMIPQRLQDDKKSTSEKQATDKPRTSDEGQDHRDHVREEHM